MISQDSNNRPSGSSAILCDAGIPIVGRTSPTGVYEIIKVNADGSLAAPTVTIPTFPDLITPDATVLAPAGVFASSIILAFGNFFITVVDAGIYTLRPFFMFNYIAVGAVSFYLIKEATTLEAYTNSRAVGVDSFSPAITDVANGLAASFYNIANIPVSANIAKTVFNNSQQFDFYLEAGNYKLLVVSQGLTTGVTTIYAGFETFSQKI